MTYFDINNESNTFLKNVAFEMSNGFVMTQYKMVYESKVRAFCYQYLPYL